MTNDNDNVTLYLKKKRIKNIKKIYMRSMKALVATYHEMHKDCDLLVSYPVSN